MSKKEIQRSKQHDWEPTKGDENKVYCTNCGIIVHKNAARRGIGLCPGKPIIDGERTEPEPHELSSDDIRANLPKMQMFVPSGADHGKCNGCGEKLRELPFNSRLAMIACNNRKCNLYRQRIRWLTIKEKPEEVKI